MALRALQVRVPAGEREPDRTMVKVGRLPGGSVVTRLAGLGEGQRSVIGIGCLLIIRQVAADTIRRRAFEFSAYVARVAVERRVRADQRKAGDLQVIKSGSEPIIHAMTLVASGGEATAHVVGFSRLIILGMA